MEKQSSAPAGGPKRKRSRRELLAGAAGALGVIGAEALVKATPAQAGSDGDVVLGNNFSSANNAGLPTTIAYSGSTYGFVATCTGASGGTGVVGDGGQGIGVQGTGTDGVLGVTGSLFSSSSGNGVHGHAPYPSSSSGIGVFGEHGGGGTGVSGQSASGRGVQGSSNGGDAGLFGTSASGEGVYGQSGSTAGTTPGTTHHGVHGVTSAPGYCGVFGEYVGSGTAAAVQGTNVTGSGQGVIGFGKTGTYGLGLSGGTGVLAATIDGTGLALNALGPAQFALSGLVSISAGNTSATVTGVSLRAGSLVLATVQNNAGVYVKYAVPNVSQSKITINLSKAVPTGKTAKVAWFVVN